MSSASLLLLERAAPLGVRDALSSAEWPSAPPSQRRVEAEPLLALSVPDENDEHHHYFSDDDDAGAGTPSTEEMSTEFDDMPGGAAGMPPTFPQSGTPPTSPTPTHAAGGANSTTPVLPAVNLAVVVWQQPRPAVVWQRPRPATPPPAVRELLRENGYPADAHFVSAVEQCVEDHACAPLTAAALLRRGVAFSGVSDGKPWSIGFKRRRVEDVAAGGAAGGAGGAAGGAAAREDAAVAAQYIAEQEQLAQYIADDHIAEVQQIEREQRERDVHTARQNLEQSERDLHTARQNAWQNVEQLRLQVQAAQHLVDQQSCELAAVQADINSGQNTPSDMCEDEGAGGQ